jgi:L-ascorbate metabolism protein UlaG (beta-lactamase superfamily)
MRLSFRRQPWVRRTAIGTLALALTPIAAFFIGGCVFSGPAYEGPRSDHFDGARFFNPGGALVDKSFGDMLRWQFNRKVGPWRDWVDAPPGSKPPQRVAGSDVRVTFVNHATVLIQTGGVNILTDPMWSERASPLSWIGPRRVRPPGIRFDDLPPIDTVVVSHNHYDHLDLPTLKRLSDRHQPRILVFLGNKALLENAGIANVREMDWWQADDIRGVRIHSVPAQHWSARGTRDRHRTLWGGYVIETGGGNVYFAGDTGEGPHFDAIAERFGPLRLAMLPIGAFRPEWFMAEAHLSPSQAVHVHERLRARRSMAIHFGTFNLGDDGEEEPVEVLRETMARKNVGDDAFWVLAFGEGRDVPPAPR